MVYLGSAAKPAITPALTMAALARLYVRGFPPGLLYSWNQIDR
jgi:hypothetical protein